MGDWRAMGSNARRRMGAPSYHGGGAAPDENPEAESRDPIKRVIDTGPPSVYPPATSGRFYPDLDNMPFRD